MTNAPTLGLSSFFLGHSLRQMGNSYTTLPNDELCRLVQEHWEQRVPGAGEGDCRDRKVLVPIPVDAENPQFFCPPRVELVPGMPVKAEVVVRQEGEDPYVQTYITPEDAIRYGFQEIPAKRVDVVCYSAEALLENGGTRSTDCEWEIVVLLCSDENAEPMTPLTMARNMLEKPGGTLGVYTAKEFAESIYYWSRRGLRVQKPSK